MWTGVQDLLELIVLLSDMELELLANPRRAAIGTVIEAHLDRRSGPAATLLVQNGTLHVGDVVVSGASYGKVQSSGVWLWLNAMISFAVGLTFLLNFWK